VLLVEDEPTVSKVVGQLLDGAGYEHLSIADHKQFATAIERYHPRPGTSARSKSAHYTGVIDKPFLVLEFLATLKHAVDES
jgi:hypothetical protein